MRGWLAWVCAIGCGGSQPAVDAACQPAMLFLSRAGGHYDHGVADDATANLSVIVDAPRELPAWPHDDASWLDLAGCISSALSPFAIAVTDVDPGTAPHLELVFTTSYWAGNAGTTAVVPDSCRNGHQLGFIFGDALPTTARACQVALISLAEMAANLSLDDDCTDFVNPATDCAPMRSFSDHDANCVDPADQPTACRCGGTTQNTFAAMTAAFPACM